MNGAIGLNMTLRLRRRPNQPKGFPMRHLKTKGSCLVLLLISLACLNSANAQSLFIPDSLNGTLIFGGAAFSDRNSAYGGSLGYGIKGSVDVRFAFAVVTGDYRGTGFGVSLEWHPIRNSLNRRVGLSIGVSAESNTHKVPSPSMESSVLYVSPFSSVSYFVPISEVVWILPLYEIRLMVRLEDNQLQSRSSANAIRSTLLHTVGLPVVIAGSGKTRYIISPNIAGSPESWQVGVEIGVVI